MRLDEEDAEDIGALIDQTLEQIERIDAIRIVDAPMDRPARDPGRRPTRAEDPFNAFVRICAVKSGATGKLTGKRVGLKDNVRLADVPMTNASLLMGDYIPSIDATVVERLLDAGATIVGKMNMDNFSMGATSETGDFGPVLNPCNPGYSAGGSSGGSAAAIASGQVDIGIGGDQAGSARIPSSWCGGVAIKATHGLVPSYGITYLDHSIDSVCPMARTVEDLALALEAIAGDDPKDPQWVRGPIRTEEYSKALTGSISGMRVGVISESMQWPDSEADVNESVRAAARRLETAGAKVEEFSIPWWQDCGAILFGLLGSSISAMVESDQEGFWRGGRCDPGWQEAYGRARRAGSDGFPLRLKVLMILGKYLRQDYCNVYWSKAQNARLTITSDLDSILQTYDILVTPTVHVKAVPLTETKERGSWKGRGAADLNKNCCPLNLTGHPALTLPCGIGSNNLPIGIQLVGRRWEEGRLFSAAAKIELNRSTSSSTMPAPAAISEAAAGISV